MQKKSCFVVMAIGDQRHNGIEVSASDLKSKYTDLIKESIESIDKNIEVIRADEVSSAGSISTDIFKRLMLSEYVVVDITYPNPNVFYELGLRHAVRNKTILIKEKGSKNNPFDVSGLRYIEYENTASGLKKLKENLSGAFNTYKESPGQVDNDFLTVALSMGMCFQRIVRDRKKEGQKKALSAILKNKEIIKAIENGNTNNFAELISNVENLEDFVDGLVDAGALED
ncbi:hypothetical protein [Parendozoicomonas haliclonae]|uniref:Nucleoside 2-deoxyribosyltransferase n=1 Tax=Parendozoicomonas haliclonae TaxID=1960125 RepID=A0A1X7AS93_9GAMM|nr:hypothetical protein [Parendozoicomonas haliclonae]SMA50968.1 hypothetical protein EHSB41UT_04789 [Parendozoicomonas haliclonae]